MALNLIHQVQVLRLLWVLPHQLQLSELQLQVTLKQQLPLRKVPLELLELLELPIEWFQVLVVLRQLG